MLACVPVAKGAAPQCRPRDRVAGAELEEGPRLATWVTGPAPEALRIGRPVEVWFDGSALK